MTKYYGDCKMTQETLDRINKDIRATLDRYYRLHDAESFFKIDRILNMCRVQNLTEDEVPAMIEMQNVIVMG